MERTSQSAVQSDPDRTRPRRDGFLTLAVVSGVVALIVAIATFFVAIDARYTAQDARSEARAAVASTDATGTDHTEDTADATHDEEEAEVFSFGEPADPSEASRTIVIEAFDIGFTPTSIEIAQGETVLFDIENVGEIAHDFTIGDIETQDAHELEMAEAASDGAVTHSPDANAILVEAGRSKVIAWKFTVPGVLQFGCHIPGHYDAGMLGTITVTPEE